MTLTQELIRKAKANATAAANGAYAAAMVDAYKADDELRRVVSLAVKFAGYDKIEAIKAVRNLFGGVSLLAAKRIVDLALSEEVAA
jgi:ribosomal protein L7/L12